jgi:tetratricopeptide (TPR) repeat protein
MLPSADRAERLDRAEVLLTRLLSAQPDNASAHAVKGWLYFQRQQFGAAIAEEKAAIADDDNLAEAHAALGVDQMFVGRSVDVFPEVEAALRLSPRDPLRNAWEQFICHAHVHLAQWDEAIEWCRKSIATNPSLWLAYIDLAAAYGWAGRDAEAKAAVAELLKLMPGFTVQKWANIRWSDNPTFLREYQRIVEGLRKAGLPEGEQKTN